MWIQDWVKAYVRERFRQLHEKILEAKDEGDMNEFEKLKKENDWLKSELEIKEKAISVLEDACEDNVELQKQLDEANKTLQIIHDIAIDYDGFKSSEGLKGLIDEIRILASDADKKV